MSEAIALCADSEKLWSHRTAQISINDPSPEAQDARETLSKRYGPGVILILPLASGRFALMGTDRQVIRIENEIPSADELRDLSEKLEQKLSARSISVSADYHEHRSTRPRESQTAAQSFALDDL